MAEKDGKVPLTASSESEATVRESEGQVISVFPKRYEIVVDLDPEDEGKIIMRRKSENLLGFELIGLLELVMADIRHQTMLRKTKRSDGIEIPDQEIRLTQYPVTVTLQDAKTHYIVRASSRGEACDLVFNALDPEVRVEAEIQAKEALNPSEHVQFIGGY